MTTERLDRQRHAFPEIRRAETALLHLGAERDPVLARVLAIGAGAMGIPVVGADDPAFGPAEGHLLAGPLPRIVQAFDASIEWVYVDSLAPEESAGRALGDRGNAWVSVDAGDPAAARRALERLARHGIRARVLLAADGPGGFAVVRAPDPAAAADALALLPAIDTGPAGLAVAAAGVVLNEVMLGPDRHDDDLGATRLVGFHSLHRPRRADVDPETPLPELFAEIGAAAAGERARGDGRRVLVGAGALGNGLLLAAALGADRGATWEIHDDDVAETTNLNRQPLLVGGVGRSKAELAAEALAGLDPAGAARAFRSRVEDPSDLGDLSGAEVVIAAPDNDEARRTVARAARTARLRFGTAGSSAVGAQVVVTDPERACFECVLPPGAAGGGSASCRFVEDDAVVATNLVAAGILATELTRERPANVRFVGTGGGGNRLTRMLTNPPCPHRRAVEVARG